MSKVKDITGQKFARLLVVSRAENAKSGKAMWNCECECGNSVVVSGANLRNGHTQSCGCFKRELIAKRSTTHGKTNTKIHAVWKTMKRRCFNKNHHKYKIYGGRGITVCDEWKNDFQAFYDYVSKLPHFGEEGYSIDRIDNDGNYEPNNVKWSTNTEQARNRRTCKYIYYEGEIITIMELSERIGVPARTLYSQIYKKERQGCV